MKSLKTDLSFITPRALQKSEVVNGWFSLKNSGYSRPNSSLSGLNVGFNTPERKGIVAQNRLILLEELSLNKHRVAYADQVHGDRVQIVKQSGTYASTDGLVTKSPGLTLAIQVADCAAVLCWEASNNVIGAFHAGWRGALAGIVPRGIDNMISEGADPITIKAFVSPCISLKNFEVGREVAGQFPDKFVDYINFDKPHIDLKRFLKYQLISRGLIESHVEIREECTVDQSQDFYSYRREGDKSGRMIALIQLSGRGL